MNFLTSALALFLLTFGIGHHSALANASNDLKNPQLEATNTLLNGDSTFLQKIEAAAKLIEAQTTDSKVQIQIANLIFQLNLNGNFHTYRIRHSEIAETVYLGLVKLSEAQALTADFFVYFINYFEQTITNPSASIIKAKILQDLRIISKNQSLPSNAEELLLNILKTHSLNAQESDSLFITVIRSALVSQNFDLILTRLGQVFDFAMTTLNKPLINFIFKTASEAANGLPSLTATQERIFLEKTLNFENSELIRFFSEQALLAHSKNPTILLSLVNKYSTIIFTYENENDPSLKEQIESYYYSLAKAISLSVVNGDQVDFSVQHDFQTAFQQLLNLLKNPQLVSDNIKQLVISEISQMVELMAPSMVSKILANADPLKSRIDLLRKIQDAISHHAFDKINPSHQLNKGLANAFVDLYEKIDKTLFIEQKCSTLFLGSSNKKIVN